MDGFLHSSIIGKYAYCFYLNEYFIGKSLTYRWVLRALTLCPLDVEIVCKTSAFSEEKMQGSVTVGLKCGLRGDSKKEQNIGGTVGRNKILMTLAEN